MPPLGEVKHTLPLPGKLCSADAFHRDPENCPANTMHCPNNACLSNAEAARELAFRCQCCVLLTTASAMLYRAHAFHSEANAVQSHAHARQRKRCGGMLCPCGATPNIERDSGANASNALLRHCSALPSLCTACQSLRLANRRQAIATQVEAFALQSAAVDRQCAALRSHASALRSQALRTR